ncbi:hypothetical protein TCAL_14377 [Tigriopus californicus]|uniref:Uncharacterized protein n=1 Tax=Tigriopus californicus TaxID=6832 RepID=A0A553PKV8_TIGCA|nr:uncharacterized protein LOC131891039 [Tigriopus californicus]XP_059096510.1 uncharacterized protein LOC131891039 [Tigriopus californicus]TRY78317.1 hypothetical protein TCAL_14377 [Tigriopus californicus]
MSTRSSPHGPILIRRYPPTATFSCGLTLESMVRHRTFVLFLLGTVSATFVLISMNRTPRSGIDSFVVETQNQLHNLKKNFEPEKSILSVSDDFLEPLGLLGPSEGLWPNASWRGVYNNASEPVIVSAVSNGREGEAVHFVRNTQFILPNLTVILYDLGLTRNGRDLLSQYCNSSLCLIRDFEFGKFPGHVSNLKIHAFRPLIIQETLKDAGCVLWLSIDQRFTQSDLQPYLQQARESGVLAWPHSDRRVPTSSMTHPKMFTRLGIKDLENFNFQHMVDLKALLLYNLHDTHVNLMGRWVRCSLIDDCIEPLGAQSTGCRFDKKPQYRYSGCHAYDVSALNIILGQMFGFNEGRYVAKAEPFFVQMGDESEEETDLTLNTTLPSPKSEEASQLPAEWRTSSTRSSHSLRKRGRKRRSLSNANMDI